MRGALRSLLEYAYHITVGTAENAKEAEELFKTRYPDITFIDILMSGEDGIPILKSLKEIDRKAKIIMVSVYGVGSKIEDAKKLGADGFVTKPYRSDEISKEIEKVLSNKK